MSNIPIKVDLSIFFKDERKCSLLLIDTSWDNIIDLQEHIQKLFKLDNISLLTNEGCFLPPQESIKILESTQALKAFKLQSSDEICTKKSIRKRKRSAEARNDASFEFVDGIKVSQQEPDDLKSKEKKMRKKKERDDQSIKKYNFNESIAQRKKDSTQDLNSSEILVLPKQIPSLSTQISSQFVSRRSPRKQHIIFNEDSSDREAHSKSVTTLTRCDNQMQSIYFHCQLMDLDCKKPRVFVIPKKLEKCKIIENILIRAPQSLETPSTEHGLLSVGESEITTETDQKNTKSTAEDLLSVAESEKSTEAVQKIKKSGEVQKAQQSSPKLVDSILNKKNEEILDLASEEQSSPKLVGSILNKENEEILDLESDDSVMLLDDKCCGRRSAREPSAFFKFSGRCN